MAKKGEGLTAQGVKHAGPGVYGDGGGLYLRVKPDGRASWTYRYQLAGVRRDLGLGRARGAAAVTLAAARVKADAARKLVAEGKDPLAERDAADAAKRAADAAKAQRAANTFRAVATAYVKARGPEWRSGKHAGQWTATLETYAYPIIGDLPVDTIGVPEVLRVLSPIWTVKPETAARVRGRLEAILDYAAATELRPRGFNPATWRGNLVAALPAVAKVKRRARQEGGKPEHHPALPWQRMPAFMRALAEQPVGMAALALRFTILTAARSNEVLGADWREVNLTSGTWTIPPERMKAGQEHRIPLSASALATLREAAALGRTTGPIFRGRDGALATVSLFAMLRRLNSYRSGGLWRDDAGHFVTVHGFRSSFRDWAGERTAFPREVAEAALAHVVGNKVERAYRRADALEKRRALMDAWASWCASEGEETGTVVPLVPRRSA